MKKTKYFFKVYRDGAGRIDHYTIFAPNDDFICSVNLIEDARRVVRHLNRGIK